jgi:predicted Rossmann-fold nucleotide-binding protein
LPGGTGTLLELALCWELTNKRFLNSIPIICLSDYWKPVIDVILESNENNASTIRLAESLDHVLQILKDHFDENSY